MSSETHIQNFINNLDKIAKKEPPKKEEKPEPKTVTAKNVFVNSESHPLILDMVLLKTFNLEWYSWLSDTLFHEIETTFKTSIAETNKIKIMAVQALHVVDTFWEEWEVFEKGIMALNGVMPLVNIMQPPDLNLLINGVAIANKLRKEKFSEEVARYCAACFIHENTHYAPAPLSFCQEYISQPMYKCKHCGKIGSALPPFDGLCDSCTEKFEHDNPFSFKPNPEALARGVGREIEYFLTYDPAPIKKRFEELNALPPEKVDIKEEPDDIEAGRLLLAMDYKHMRDSQLKEQLTNLKGWLETA